MRGSGFDERSHLAHTYAMHDLVLAAIPTLPRETLAVTVWNHPEGGLDIWLNDLALDADGADEFEARRALIQEVRWLTDEWLENDHLRNAPNWQRRGVLLAWLATLSDSDLNSRLRLNYDVSAGPPLDDAPIS